MIITLKQIVHCTHLTHKNKKKNCSATQKLFEDNCAEHSLPEVE